MTSKQLAIYSEVACLSDYEMSLITCANDPLIAEVPELSFGDTGEDSYGRLGIVVPGEIQW